MSSQNSMIGRSEIPSQTLINNRYLVQQILGQGGNGRTYLALDTHRFNEPCVLKEFAPFASEHYDHEKSRSLFKREAEILHQITHPQIPRFLACFEVKERLFLVQEYVNGKTYSALLEELQQHKQVFSELEIVKWLKNLLPILNYIHQLGIIHRDISPDNIMQPPGKSLPVLIDFGVGKLTNLSHQELSFNSHKKHSYVGKMSFVGKIGYAPKEQITMGRCYPSSDIYALGVTALVLLTGKDPTALVDQYSLEWQWHKYAQVSENLTNILSQMTEEKPLKRYRSAKEALQHLERCYPNISAKNTATSSLISPPSPLSTNPSSNKSINDETIILAPWESHLPKTDDTLIVTGVNSDSPASSAVNTPSNPHSKIPPQIDNTMIVSSLDFTAQEQQLIQPITQSVQPKFIKRCEQELAYYIGSVASLIVQEVMEKQQPSSTEELVDALLDYLPDQTPAREFKNRLAY